MQGFNDLIESLKLREKNNNFLNKIKNLWEINDKGFYVKINDFIPISNLIIKFDEPHPKQIILDSNDNKIYDEKDMYFFQTRMVNLNQFKIIFKEIYQ